MAFPVVAERMAYQVIGPATSFNVNLPAVVNADDALLVIIRFNNTFSTGPGGSWVNVANGIQGVASIRCFGLDATGSEGGTTINFTTTGSATIRAVVYRIVAGSWLSVEGAGANSAAGQDPDPPNLAPSWGADDNLWIAAAGVQTAAGTTVSYPANYTNGDNSSFTAFVAQREVNASSDNPGVFDIDGANAGYQSLTLAVRGAPGPPLVSDTPLPQRRYRSQPRMEQETQPLSIATLPEDLRFLMGASVQ